jgi:hypothetical protein
VALQNLPLLEELMITVNRNGDLHALGRLRSLRALTIAGEGVNALDILKDCQKLESLSISLAERYRAIDFVTTPMILRDLTLRKIGAENLDPLAAVTSIESLKMAHLNLANLEFLTALPSLRHLEVLFPQSGASMPYSRMTELRSLVLSNSTYYASQGIRYLDGLAEAQYLERLSLLDPPGIDFGQCFPSSLRHLSISNYFDVRNLDLGGITDLDGLETVEFEGCCIAEFEPLMQLPNLRTAAFRQCTCGIAVWAKLLTALGVQVYQD